VDEDVLGLAVGRDEPVALRVVEPLDGAGSHVKNTLPLITNGKGRCRARLRRLLVLFVAVRVARWLRESVTAPGRRADRAEGRGRAGESPRSRRFARPGSRKP